MADITPDETTEVVIRDSVDHTRELTVNTDGSLNNVLYRINPDTATSNPELQILNSFVKDSKSFSLADSLNMATGNVDNPLLLVKNPAASGKTLYLYFVNGGTSVSNVSAVFKLWYNPTITTNGTSKTPIQNRIGSSTASVMTAFSLPTLTSNGTLLTVSVQGQNNNSPLLVESMCYQLTEGNNLLLTGSPLLNNRVAHITMRWVEA